MIAHSLLLLSLAGWPLAKKGREPVKTPLEEHIESAHAIPRPVAISPGSTFVPGSRLGDLARDFRANQAGDIVTIVVFDRASALNRGVTTATRKSSANASVTSIAGPTKAAGALANLAGLTGQSQLQGQGETSRTNTLSTTLSARVTEVLPNGDLVVEGTKQVGVNSDRQTVTVRGVIRWNDLSNSNQVRSDRIAQLEVRVAGKGVVNDAVRRPNILYRLLLGALPF
jgi:flagellar L-ring protein precursor FlgH